MSSRLARLARLAAAAAFAAALATACAMPAPPTRTALVYGVSIYEVAYPEGYSNNLTFTDDDARAIAASLTSAGWDVTLGLADTQVASESQDATRAAIEADIAALEGTEGLVLFYYSGHGDLDAYGGSRILPFGSIQAESDRIRPDQLFSMFEAAGLENVVVILDSCHSGGFVGDGPTVDAVPAIYDAIDENRDIAYTAFVDSIGDALSALVSYRAGDRYVVISAAGSGELSWETGSVGHGVFTAGVLNAFDDAGADRDGDGYVSTGELYAYAASYIASSWNGDQADYYTSGQYADFYPHVSGVAREYALWAAP